MKSASPRQTRGFILAQPEQELLDEAILSTGFIFPSGDSIKTTQSLTEYFSQYPMEARLWLNQLRMALEIGFRWSGTEQPKEKANSILYSFLGLTTPTTKLRTQSLTRTKSPKKKRY